VYVNKELLSPFDSSLTKNLRGKGRQFSEDSVSKVEVGGRPVGKRDSQFGTLLFLFYVGPGEAFAGNQLGVEQA
jgi:hypothetical protein